MFLFCIFYYLHICNEIEIGKTCLKIKHLALFFLPKFAPNKLHLISALQFGKGKIPSLNLDQ